MYLLDFRRAEMALLLAVKLFESGKDDPLDVPVQHTRAHRITFIIPQDRIESSYKLRPIPIASEATRMLLPLVGSLNMRACCARTSGGRRP